MKSRIIISLLFLSFISCSHESNSITPKMAQQELKNFDIKYVDPEGYSDRTNGGRYPLYVHVQLISDTFKMEQSRNANCLNDTAHCTYSLSVRIAKYFADEKIIKHHLSEIISVKIDSFSYPQTIQIDTMTSGMQYYPISSDIVYFNFDAICVDKQSPMYCWSVLEWSTTKMHANNLKNQYID
jgi:hypothetical protein